MATQRTCDECGAELPANAPQGLCPRCLANMGMSLLPVDTISKPGIQIERIGTMIGRYKLLEKIGEGGFGVVFMAEQQEPVQRKVALKIIKAGMDTREVIARFEAERQAIALMDHPNIARALDAGATETGRPYFVMELVRGIPITDYCDQRNLPTRERLQLFIKVCQAVQHAHQKGVIHRDLKPSNVLVTEHDGEPVPKVIDFGVAKALGQKLTEKTLFTAFHHLIGTPAYMSPEQAALSGLDIDTRADIYSLGVLLYELLTGVTPFDGETFRTAAMDEIRRMIRETEPPKPSTRLQTLGAKLAEVAKCRHTDPAALSRLVRGDLDWIVMRCLEKDRKRRYETANGLAADVARHLDSEPIVARPPSNLYRFQKMFRRHKLAFAAACAVATSLVIGLGVSSWLLMSEKQARAQTTEKLYESYVAQARANRLSGRPGRYFDTLETIAKAVAIRPSLESLELRNELIASLALVDLRTATVGEMNSADHQFLRFDPTLEIYAQLTREGEISVRRVSDNQETGLLPTRGMGVRWLNNLTPGGRYLYFSSAKLGNCVWDVRKGELALQEMKWDLFFSPDGGSCVSLEPDGFVSIYDLESRQIAHRKTAASPSALAKSLDPTGSRLACFHVETLRLEVVELQTGAVITSMEIPSPCHELAWSANGRWLAAACVDGHAYIWDAASGARLQTCVGHGGEVIRLAFNHAGTLLATTSWDETVRLWDPSTGTQLLRTRGSSWQMQFSPDDSRLAFVPKGTKFELLEVTSHPEYRHWFACRDTSGGLRLTVNLHGQLAATTWGGVRFWDFADGKEVGFLPERGSYWAIFDPGEKSLITCGLAGLKRWPMSAQKAARHGEFQIGPDPEVYAAAGSGLGSASMSADGNKIAFVHYYQNERDVARVIDLRNPDKVIALGSHAGVQFLSISPNGKWVATGTWNGSDVKVWDAENGTLLSTLPARRHATVLFSPDGHWLVTGTEGYHLWETETWKPGPPIRCSPEDMMDASPMAFSPDSQLLAIASRNEAVRLLETKTGRTLADFDPPTLSIIHSFCFNRDGSQLFASDGLGQIHVWDLRLIRQRLAAMKLDWDMPPYSRGDAPQQAQTPPH